MKHDEMQRKRRDFYGCIKPDKIGKALQICIECKDITSSFISSHLLVCFDVLRLRQDMFLCYFGDVASDFVNHVPD